MGEKKVNEVILISHSLFNMAQSKYYCFTSFETDLTPEFQPTMSYLIYGLEMCPDTQRMHWQGYVEFERKTRFNTAKARLGLTNAVHIEIRKGTAAEAATYCKKEGQFTEHGVISVSNQGKRKDIDECVDMIRANKSLKEVAEQFPSQFIRIHKGLTALKCLMGNPRKEMTKGIYIVGESGCGKTRYVYDTHGYENVYKKDPNTKWFDGYDGQKVVLIDDYRGVEEKSDITMSYLLNWCDRYPMTVEIKGGSVNFNPDFIYITSNTYPESWFGAWKDLAPFYRRFERKEL